MKLALVREGDDYGIFDDAEYRAGKKQKLGMLNLNMADVTIEAKDVGSKLPAGSFHSLNAALIALTEAGFQFEKYE